MFFSRRRADLCVFLQAGLPFPVYVQTQERREERREQGKSKSRGLFSINLGSPNFTLQFHCQDHRRRAALLTLTPPPHPSHPHPRTAVGSMSELAGKESGALAMICAACGRHDVCFCFGRRLEGLSNASLFPVSLMRKRTNCHID